MSNISNYAHQSITNVLKEFGTGTKGLSSTKIKRLTQLHGPNSFTVSKKTSPLIEYLNNFKEPLILVLIAIAIISYVMGETINGVIITAMVFLSVTLNFIQEHRAGLAAQKLQEKVALRVTVIRDGKEQDIAASKLVPGDLLVLNAGDLIPADARVLEAKDLFINQGPLTGESFPVEKSPDPPTSPQTAITSISNLLFAGTSVTTGSGRALVIKTGMQTEFSHIVSALSKADTMNDFSQGIRSFSRLLVRWILAFVLIIFFVSALFKHDLFTSFSFAIAVAVSLTPEFLPMVMSVTMAQGALLLSKKGIIVKKLVAIPAFGSMDILCTDKTGTLTQDNIQLVTYTDIHGRSSDAVLRYAYINSFLETGINNPLDEAIKAYKHISLKNVKKIDEIPFDFNRRRLSIAVQMDGQQLLITKGAPETVIPLATYLETAEKKVRITAAHRRRLEAEYQRLSRQGFRVLAVATKELPRVDRPFTVKDETDVIFVGFTAFLDPVKSGIKEAIDSLEAIGIEIKVISGDNELVCEKTCHDADIEVKGILLGQDVDRLSNAQLSHRLENTTICARFSPVQKERVIGLLRQAGHVVGYMGDGINDAPSLKAADIGISVSNAVDVAKEAADLIMTHKSLADLKEGVIAGRKIFGNTMKYVQMGFSSNFGNMFSILGAVIFLPFLPMLPLQILLNNFLYDIAQITIPTDNIDPEYVNQPKRWDLAFIKRFTLIMGPLSSLFDFITFYYLYQLFSHSANAFQTGWFMVSLATQTLVIYVIRTKKIPFLQSTPSPLLIISSLLVVITAWVIPFTSLGAFFSLVALPLPVMLTLAGIVVVYLFLAQFLKQYTYRS
jgi:P-type Mg2+ transporter